MLVAHAQLHIHCDHLHHEPFSSVLLPSLLILSVWGNPAPGAGALHLCSYNSMKFLLTQSSSFQSHSGLNLCSLAGHPLPWFIGSLVVFITFSNYNCILTFCITKGILELFPKHFSVKIPNNCETYKEQVAFFKKNVVWLWSHCHLHSCFLLFCLHRSPSQRSISTQVVLPC